ncbi:MAG: ROK family protein [Phycisphaerae bacterium]|jgi:glucokinase
MKDLYIGIDLGGTFVKVGCFTEKMEMISKISVPTDGHNPEATMLATLDAIQAIVSRSGHKTADIKAAGVGSPGVLDSKNGIIITSPNLQDYRGFHITQFISDRLGAPCVLENDANVAGWGEYVLGAGGDVDDMVLVTLGTGIGGAVISDGRLLKGAENCAAEIGHMIIIPDGRLCKCTQHGCVEAYASATATVQQTEEMLADGAVSTLQDIYIHNGAVTCADVFRHAEQGDRLAVEITGKTCNVLGLLCVNIFSYSNPGKILFSGGMIAAGDYLLSRIRKSFKKYLRKDIETNMQIDFATLGENSGIIGSAALARDTFCLV